MKKIVIVLIAIGFFSTSAIAQKLQKSPLSVVTSVVGTTEIKINYHRPGLKGRSMESLAPLGKVWRTGANQATEITFSKAVKMGGKEVAAGTYSLYSVPGKSEWTFIINSKLSWGTQYSKDKDVVRFSGTASSTSQSNETFTISISDISEDGKKANLELRWGKVIAKAPFEVTL